MSIQLPQYPTTPCAISGRARKKYKGKDYYFGEYGTPQSYALFAEWAAEIEKTGIASPAEELPSQVAEHSPKPETKPVAHRPRSFMLLFFMAASAIAGAGFASVVMVDNTTAPIQSPIIVTTLDGEELTDDEQKIVRAIRDKGIDPSSELAAKSATRTVEMGGLDLGPDKMFMPTPEEAKRDVLHGGMTLEQAVEAKRKRLMQISKNPQIVGEFE